MEEHVNSTHSEHQTSQSDYESSPIKTLGAGFRAVWGNGKQVMAGLLAAQFVIFIIGVVLVGIAFLAIFIAIFAALLANGNQYTEALYGLITSQLPENALNTLNGFMSTAAGTLVTAGVLAGTLGFLMLAFMQSSLVSLASTTVVHRQAAHFGQIMSQAFKKLWPLLLQGALLMAVVLATATLLALLVGALYTVPGGAALIVLVGFLGLVLAIVAVYLSLRLSLAPLAIFSENMGPIQSLKHSWKLTKGRLWELLGTAAAVGVIGTIVQMLFNLVHNSLRGNDSLDLVVIIVEIVVNLFVAILSVGVLAERFRQFRATGENKGSHKVNYPLNVGAFIVAIVLSIIASGIQSSMQPKTQNYFDENYLQDLLEDSDTTPPTEQELQNQLEKLYEESQMYTNPDGTFDYSKLN